MPDEFFENDGQLTKREIRAVTLSALAPRAGERFWDIGCGSGSVSIEWLLRHPANTATAIERDPERAARAARNATTLGVPHLEIVQGTAPEALADLPAPDAVFIGGGGQGDGVIEQAWAALRPGGRMVVNSVTLETEAKLIEALGTYGGTLTRLSGRTAGDDRHAPRLPPGDDGDAVGGGETMIVAGIGCRTGCGADEIVALIGDAVKQAGIANCKFTALAAPRFKEGEAGPREAAERMHLPLLLIDDAAMKAAEPRCPTRSDKALEATGFSSVAEGRRPCRRRCQWQARAAAHCQRHGDLRPGRKGLPMTVHFIGAGPGAPDPDHRARPAISWHAARSVFMPDRWSTTRS